MSVPTGQDTRLPIGPLPAAGLVYSDVIVSYAQPDDTSWSTVTMSAAKWADMDSGAYKQQFTAAEIGSAQGVFMYKAEPASGGTYEDYDYNQVDLAGDAYACYANLVYDDTGAGEATLTCHLEKNGEIVTDAASAVCLLYTTDPASPAWTATMSSDDATGRFRTTQSPLALVGDTLYTLKITITDADSVTHTSVEYITVLD